MLALSKKVRAKIQIAMKQNRILERFANSNTQSYPRINELGPQDLVIDCGANIGDISSAYLQKGCKVIAFEPNPHCIAFIRKRFGKKNNLILENKALSEKTGVSRLFCHQLQEGIDFSSGSSLEQEKGNINTGNYFEVETIKLSEYIARMNQKISLLKIDIECHEDIVLYDLITNNSFEQIDFAVVEVHDDKYEFMVPRIKQLKQVIAKNNLQDKIDLTWH